jgi:hypothetical protein
MEKSIQNPIKKEYDALLEQKPKYVLSIDPDNSHVIQMFGDGSEKKFDITAGPDIFILEEDGEFYDNVENDMNKWLSFFQIIHNMNSNELKMRQHDTYYVSIDGVRYRLIGVQNAKYCKSKDVIFADDQFNIQYVGDVSSGKGVLYDVDGLILPSKLSEEGFLKEGVFYYNNGDIYNGKFDKNMDPCDGITYRCKTNGEIISKKVKTVSKKNQKKYDKKNAKKKAEKELTEEDLKERNKKKGVELLRGVIARMEDEELKNVKKDSVKKWSGIATDLRREEEEKKKKEELQKKIEKRNATLLRVVNRKDENNQGIIKSAINNWKYGAVSKYTEREMDAKDKEIARLMALLAEKDKFNNQFIEAINNEQEENNKQEDGNILSENAIKDLKTEVYKTREEKNTLQNLVNQLRGKEKELKTKYDDLDLKYKNLNSKFNSLKNAIHKKEYENDLLVDNVFQNAVENFALEDRKKQIMDEKDKYQKIVFNNESELFQRDKEYNKLYEEYNKLYFNQNRIISEYNLLYNNFYTLQKNYNQLLARSNSYTQATSSMVSNNNAMSNAIGYYGNINPNHIMNSNPERYLPDNNNIQK